MKNHYQYKNCNLCPRNCNADRESGRVGICGVGATVRLARADLHFGEEPCISGENGSGTVFFSGCSLHCVFCQNYKIANGSVGKDVSTERLAEIFLELQEKSATNINLVTPGHYVPHIIAAVELAKREGLHLPIVYNTSSYEKVDTLKQLEGIVDIYLPDFKYMNPEHAQKYSHAKDYPSVAKAAIEEMVRQQPLPRFTADGALMTKGVLVRQLLLPGLLKDAKNILRYLYETYGNQIYFSLMSQYTPLPHVTQYPELNRVVNKKEYDALVDYAIDLGVEQGFVQEGDVASDNFIPDFDLKGV